VQVSQRRNDAQRPEVRRVAQGQGGLKQAALLTALRATKTASKGLRVASEGYSMGAWERILGEILGEILGAG
jgi:hypothetical protein